MRLAVTWEMAGYVDVEADTLEDAMKKFNKESDYIKLPNGDYVDEDNLDEVREYTKNCKGITKEVNPSIKMCLRNHEKVKAIMIYRDRHPGIGLKEAKDAIDMIEAKMKVRREI